MQSISSSACSYRQLASQQQRRAAAVAPAASAAAGSSTAGRPQKDAQVSQGSDVASQDEPQHQQKQQQQQELPELQLQLPEPTNIQVKTAEFVKSSVKVGDCPPAKYPEFAVIGRSNVGKSSLINMLTSRKSLAMVSKQPGEQSLGGAQSMRGPIHCSNVCGAVYSWAAETCSCWQVKVCQSTRVC
jgi:ATPase subunit of ABC transporter with duplicated ATPase domains